MQSALRQLPLVSLLAFCPVPPAAADEPGFSVQSWQEIRQASGEWSRLSMIRDFAGRRHVPGMSRASMIGLLGPADYSAQNISSDGAEERFTDVYLLSSENDSNYVVTYDSHERVKETATSFSPCVCVLCQADAPFAAPAELRGKLKELGPMPSVAKVEALVGVPGKRTTVVTQAGQAWVNYAVTWRMDLQGRYFVAQGQKPRRDWNSAEFGAQALYSYAVITASSACRPR